MGQKVLIISPNCPACERLKGSLTEKGALEKLRVCIVVDVTTAEGARWHRYDYSSRLGLKF